MPELFCVATLEEAEALVAKYEVDNTLQFSSQTCTKNFGKITLNDFNNDGQGGICVRTKDPQPSKTILVLQADDPFTILGKRTMYCVYGRDTARKHKLRVYERNVRLGISKHRKVNSKRKGCPARIVIRHLVVFPGFKEAKTTSQQLFIRAIRRKLKNKEYVPHEYRFYVYLPGTDEHANHPTEHDDGLRYSMAAPLRDRIQELAQMGVHSPAAIKIHLKYMVENELFKGKTPPPKTNCMYWPNTQHIYSTVYRFKKSGRCRNKSFKRNYEAIPQNMLCEKKTDQPCEKKIDQPCDNTSQAQAGDRKSDLLHYIVNNVGLNETGENAANNGAVSSPKSPKTKTQHVKHISYTTVHQNGATILTRLPVDRNDAPKQAPLPIIRVINPSQNLGQGQLFLNCLTPQKEVAHTSINLNNTTNKVQQRQQKRATSQNRNAQQEGHFFKVHQVQPEPNGVQEAHTPLFFMPIPSEAMCVLGNSVKVRATPNPSQLIFQPTSQTPLESLGTSSDQCVAVQGQDVPFTPMELENIYQQLAQTESPTPIVTDSCMEEAAETYIDQVSDTYLDEVSVLTSPLDDIESHQPMVFTNNSAHICSSTFSDTATTNSPHNHIVHDHDYGSSARQEGTMTKPIVSNKMTVKGRESKLKPNFELATSSIEDLKDLLDTRDIPTIVSAFIDVPSLKAELVRQLVKLY